MLESVAVTTFPSMLFALVIVSDSSVGFLSERKEWMCPGTVIAPWVVVLSPLSAGKLQAMAVFSLPNLCHTDCFSAEG